MVLKSEIERMNSENQRLKEMLNKANNNYNDLHMYLQTLIMQKHQKGVAEEVKNGLTTHRQFVELGIPTATNANDVVSPSSDDGRMPPNEIGGEGHDQSPQNKFPIHSNNGVDQATEATIRKARVSVRARCEGPMVYIMTSLCYISCFILFKIKKKTNLISN